MTCYSRPRLLASTEAAELSYRAAPRWGVAPGPTKGLSAPEPSSTTQAKAACSDFMGSSWATDSIGDWRAKIRARRAGSERRAKGIVCRSNDREPRACITRAPGPEERSNPDAPSQCGPGSRDEPAHRGVLPDMEERTMRRRIDSATWSKTSGGMGHHARIHCCTYRASPATGTHEARDRGARRARKTSARAAQAKSKEENRKDAVTAPFILKQSHGRRRNIPMIISLNMS